MNKEIFLNGMTELSTDITNEQTERFARYSSLLVEWNKKMNLTAVTDDDGISVKHFLDSVLPIYHTDLNKCRNGRGLSGDSACNNAFGCEIHID